MKTYEEARDNWLDAHYRSEPLQQAKLHAGYGWDACKSFSDKQHEERLKKLEAGLHVSDQLLKRSSDEINRLTYELDKSRDSHQAIIRAQESIIADLKDQCQTALFEVEAQDKIISAMEEALDGIKWGKHCTACSCGCHGVAGKALTSLKEFREKYK